MIKKLLSPIIIVLLMIGATSCGDDFDYNPNLENRTIYNVVEYTINDNNLDNVEGFRNYNRNPYYGYCETLKDYYDYYFQEMTLLVWDNGKYEVNEFVLREGTDPQKPKIRDGKVTLNFKRTKHNESFSDKGYYFGYIKMIEVGHNRYDCEIYDDEYNVTFSATVQFDEGVR